MVSHDGNIDLNSLLGQSFSLQIKQLRAFDCWLNSEVIFMEFIGQESNSSLYIVFKCVNSEMIIDKDIITIPSGKFDIN